MCLVRGENILGIDQMGQLRVGLTEFKSLQIGLINDKAALSSSWKGTSQTIALSCCHPHLWIGDQNLVE